MPNPSEIKRHADLVDRMAAVQGIDLEEAVLRGQTQTTDIADVVLTCTACTNPGGCAHWLEAHADGADAVPSYCRNGQFFDLLKDV